MAGKNDNYNRRDEDIDFSIAWHAHVRSVQHRGKYDTDHDTTLTGLVYSTSCKLARNVDMNKLTSPL